MNLRKLSLVVIDYVLVLIGLVLALGLRLDFEAEALDRYLCLANVWFYVFSSMGAIVAFYLFGLYDKVWRYAGVHELFTMLYAVLIVAVPVQVFVLLGGGEMYPRTCPVMAACLWLALCGGIRFALRVASSRARMSSGTVRRVLIVGASDAGEVVVRELLREHSQHVPVGFVDDDASRKGMRIHGVPVLGRVEQVGDFAVELDVQEVIMASPAPAVVRTVVSACSSLQIRLRVVPSIADVVEGNVVVNGMREVRIEDLLERDPVNTDMAAVRSYLSGKRVLVTGAGGSIGSEICRQLVALGVKQLVLMGRGENSIYEIGIELRDYNVVSYICELNDRARMRGLFEKYRPEVVFHTAAHKHVPLMELNPVEAVHVNVFGTMQLLELAREFAVEKLITISTDKAVNPTSVMGASKRMAELYLASRRFPGFAAVRFGNVLGSRGSVIPTFRKQIARGGPVTVTDPEMTRFFMTIPEAVSLVLQAGAMAQGGEIYILDMGKPVKIIDLASNLIRLSGFEPNVDIPIKVVGLRPGEKLYEELVNTGEDTEKTAVNKITRVTSAPPSADWPGPVLEELREACEQADDATCLRILGELVMHR